MTPYRVSVWTSAAANARPREFKLYGTYADSDDEALRSVSDAMPEGWLVDGIVGLLPRVEADRLGLTPGEVREL